MAETVLGISEQTTRRDQVSVNTSTNDNAHDELEDKILAEEETPKDETLYCDPCLDDSQQLPAEGFCETCSDFLCEHCLKCHTVPRPFRGHILKSKQEMPRFKPKQITPVTREGELCPFHKRQYITLFCNEHKQLCCEQCVEVAHGLCKDMNAINKLAANIDNEKEFQEFFRGLKTLIVGYKETQSISLFQIKEIEWYYERTLSTFKQTLDQRRQKDMENMANTVDICDKVIDKLNKTIHTVQSCIAEKDYNGLYIKMKSTPVQTDIIRDNLERLNKANHFQKYVFDSTECPTSFGIVKRVSRLDSTISTGEVGCYQLVLRANNELSAVHHRSIVVVDTPLKKRKHCLTYFAHEENEYFSDNEDKLKEEVKNAWRYVLEDAANGIVVFLQPNRRSCIAHTDRNYNCWNTEYWTTIQISESFSLAAVMGENIIAFTDNPCNIIVLDLSGRTTTRVIRESAQELTSNGEKYIGNPSSAVLDKKSNVLYVTDAAMDSVFKITDDGDIHCIVKSVHLASPKGIAFADDGSLIVCCTKGKCVVRITLDGQIYSLIGPLEFEPSAVAYDAKQSVVYVGGNCDSIYIFSVSDEYPRDVKGHRSNSLGQI